MGSLSPLQRITLQNLVWVCFLLALFVRPATAAEPALDDTLAAQLAAGEFAPALQSALQNESPAARDRQLATIAEAQFAARMRTAGVATAREISDDRVRTVALAHASQRYLAMGGQRCFDWGMPDDDKPKNDLLGGAVQPDFESLIELMEGTIAPTTWVGVGGQGAVDSFAAGVYVDALGVLAPLVRNETSGRLASLHIGASSTENANDSPLATRHHTNAADSARHQSPLRMISLPRLERAAQLRLAAGKSLSEEMKYLAGLQRIEYVFVYPQTNDLVIAGPADDWRTVAEDRVVGANSTHPVLRLEDLVVILRHMQSAKDARFGCSITPTQENLARTQAFLQASSKSSLPAGKRTAWLASLREKLGKQTIDVSGLDPRTRAARVLVEADYRMKLVGMGLEPGVLGVESYLDQIKIERGGLPPAIDVLRWWFTLNYRAVLATADRKAFEIRGQGVKVLSENELLTAQGKRVHTGKSDELNTQFAQSFTENFPQLAAKYPIYAELRNLCDMALVCALVREEKLAERSNWHATWFGAENGYPVQLATAPREVETVINHRVIQRRHIVAGVSGGVSVDPNSLVTHDAIEVDTYGDLEAESLGARPVDLPQDVWWWER
jgi:hypothetical protein